MKRKRPENEALNTLKGECNFLFKKLGEHSDELDAYLIKVQEKAYLIAAAYALNNIYSCYEDIFKHIAHAFENRIENPATWHSELLKRMLIDVPDIRPAVITEESYSILDELRSFRHVFRSSYVFKIDAARTSDLAFKWRKSGGGIKRDIESFLRKIGV